MADITGAFFAGLIITKTTHTNYIERRFSTLSYLLLSPVFFANIGLQVVLPEMSTMIIVFAVVLSVIVTSIFCKYWFTGSTSGNEYHDHCVCGRTGYCGGTDEGRRMRDWSKDV